MKIIVSIIVVLTFILPCKSQTNAEKQLVSHLEIYDLETKARTLVYSSESHFEAPNWTNNGKLLVFNSKGKLYKIPVSGESVPEEINTGFATKCNNDHLLSPDGKQIAVSHHIEENNLSKIFILPFEGGTPKLVTEKGPSYLHGWSVDGKRLAYCADRNGDYNIFSIDTSGGNETQLTSAKGLDDGPEYSPDGKYIYFNSVRTGMMQIWRMKTNGSEQTQITNDGYHDWFAHVSPNNKKIVFLSYDKTVDGHPANKTVWLRMMNVGENKPEILFELFGGQGTINVPSWSTDSKRFAFVSYELK
jgi:TolB protein